MNRSTSAGRRPGRGGVTALVLGLGLGLAGQGLAGTAGIFARYTEINNPTIPGYNTAAPRAVGKLFTSAGVCTATVISPANIIVTAASCCWNRASRWWVGGWVFSPAYHRGHWVAPFPWQQAIILNSWITAGDTPSDICLIQLAPNAQGRTVSSYTGWVGRTWNQAGNAVYHVLGYPGYIGNAENLIACVAESFSVATPGCHGDLVLNMGCDMGYGATGAPWFLRYRDGNYINGVVHGTEDVTCNSAPFSTFKGARFTSNNIVPLCNMMGC